MNDNLFKSTHLPKLPEKYRLDKFLIVKGNTYLRLVKMSYANFIVTDDKVSCYVMHKHVVIDYDVFTNDFGMDSSQQSLVQDHFLIMVRMQPLISFYLMPPLRMEVRNCSL